MKGMLYLQRPVLNKTNLNTSSLLVFANRIAVECGPKTFNSILFKVFVFKIHS